MDYSEIYVLRANRFGNDYQSRVQGERESLFERFLQKSIYRVDFMYESELHPGSLEPNKQDKTQTLQYLLTRTSLDIPSGTILDINDHQWMIFYKEDYVASGYNRYIVLKMSHLITWTVRDSKTYTEYGYLFSLMTSSIFNATESTKNNVVFNENSRYNHVIMPFKSNMKVDDYVKVNIGSDNQQQFRVMGVDTVSTEGVMYVTLDPVFVYDETSAPPYDGTSDTFWLYGGDE